MITPQELRLGNLVDYEHTTHVIKELHNDKVLHVWIEGVSDGYYTPYESIEPIPLTEGWLIKAGFEKKNDFGSNETYWNGSIDLTNDLVLSTSERYYDSMAVSGVEPIKYVHQLQNLTFALTGKELEFKEIIL